MKQEEGEKACIMALLHIWDIFRDSSAAVSVPAHSQNTQCTLQNKNIIRNTECSALCSEYTLMPCNAIRAFFRPKIDKMQRWRVKIRFQRHLAMFVKQLQWKVTLSSGRIFGISRVWRFQSVLPFFAFGLQMCHCGPELLDLLTWSGNKQRSKHNNLVSNRIFERTVLKKM